MRKPVKKGMTRCRKPGGEGTVPSKALEVGNGGKKAEPGTEIPELRAWAKAGTGSHGAYKSQLHWENHSSFKTTAPLTSIHHCHSAMMGKIGFTRQPLSLGPAQIIRK